MEVENATDDAQSRFRRTIKEKCCYANETTIMEWFAVTNELRNEGYFFLGIFLQPKRDFRSGSCHFERETERKRPSFVSRSLLLEILELEKCYLFIRLLPVDPADACIERMLQEMYFFNDYEYMKRKPLVVSEKHLIGLSMLPDTEHTSNNYIE